MDDNLIGSEVFKQAWAVKLQEMLDEDVKWKDICRVEYTDKYIIHNPYLTDISVATNTRGCPYQFKAILITDSTTTISTSQIISQFIDRADLAQLSYSNQMELAARQGVILNEAIESAVYTAVATASTGGTDMGTETFTNTAGETDITVSATNIDDIIRAIKREIREAGGESLLERHGGFIVWRPADLEILEGFMQANGFATADRALGGGVSQGINYMGMTHYSSNLLTSTHVAAGVKKQIHLGILKNTYGQVMVNEKDPNNQSGISVTCRVDYAVKIWNVSQAIIFDVNVS